MFELTDDEVENLRSNFLTANLNSKSRYNPHVFTEQGLYMLMKGFSYVVLHQRMQVLE